MEVLLAALAGLLIGSFLNVCIHRWPQDLSVVWPGSCCPQCGHAITWYDNVPGLSYLMLRARCRHCLAAIPWRYPAVELFTALCFAAAAVFHGFSPTAVKLAVFSALQIGMIFSDLEVRLLPDQFTLGGMYLGFAGSWLDPLPRGLFQGLVPIDNPRMASLLESLLAAAFASGALWLTGYLYSVIRRREGLGFGDVKMIAMIAAFIGFAPTFLVIFLGCAGGAVTGIAYILLTKKDPSTYELPFGTFLGIAAIVVAFRAL